MGRVLSEFSMLRSHGAWWTQSRHDYTLQHTTAQYSTLQKYSALQQHTATTHCNYTIKTRLHTAAHYSTLQHIKVHYSTLQHTTAHYSTLQQHTATTHGNNTLQQHNQDTITYFSTLQHTSAHVSTLQHTTTTHCNNTLQQHTATPYIEFLIVLFYLNDSSKLALYSNYNTLQQHTATTQWKHDYTPQHIILQVSLLLNN